MAKKKLDWFKLDCQLDDSMKLIELEFGLYGFAIIVKLWQKIYGGEGYYCGWNSDVALMFAGENHISVGTVSEIVSAAIRRGIFDKEKFNEFGILTSHGIQTRYFDCAERRKNQSLKPEYLLLCNTPKPKNVDNSSKNADISKKNANIFSQRREEERREDKSRGEESNSPDGSAPLLPQSDYDSLVSEFGKEITDRYVLKMSTYIKEYRNGKPYKAPAAMIKKWISEDKPEIPKDKSYDLSEVDEFGMNYLMNRKKKKEDTE
ncbi:MAG: DUF4373 domain-containing protein [Oscillospiraceae bacterium]|nr:DUF4373 domain-containing protein [Oscillospiraceae bacterium]